jgi:hypothetical protein
VNPEADIDMRHAGIGARGAGARHALLAVILLWLAGCSHDLTLPETKPEARPGEAPRAADGVSGQPIPPAATPEPVPASGLRPAEPGVPSAPGEPEAKSAKPPLYHWTETPTLDSIPHHEVVGEVNGKEFQVKAVVFQPGPHGWDMMLADKPLISDTADLTDCQYLIVELSEPPAKGQKLQRKMDYGGGSFRLVDPKEPTNWTSWNADNAFVLEISEWNVKPRDPKGHATQVAGTAAGRLAVCYRAKGDFTNSWVAGTFTKALVRYLPEVGAGVDLSNLPD